MLGGLKYVKELTAKLDLSASAGGHGASSAAEADARPHAAGPAAAKMPGDAFLEKQHALAGRVTQRHEQLLASGETLAMALASTRKQLLDQVEGEQYLVRNFATVTGQVRSQLARMRSMVERIASEIEDVEDCLMKQTEEFMAAQNAAFASSQQHELERFEDRILEEKEERTRILLEERRQVLAQAFQNDLKAYQTLMTAASGHEISSSADANETLESIDLMVTADKTQLDAFYDSGSESDAEEEERKTQEQDDLATASVEVQVQAVAPEEHHVAVLEASEAPEPLETQTEDEPLETAAEESEAQDTPPSG